MSSSCAIQLVRNTHNILQQEQDLSPHNQLVNITLTNFVSGLSDHFFSDTEENIAHDLSLFDERQQLPLLCGKAECAMEEYWAEKFLSYPTLDASRLQDFWYYQNYDALWSLEKHMLGAISQSKFVFLGSGPLPLTAIIAALKDPDMRIDCVDYDSHACNLSHDLVAKLGLSHQINIVQSAATDYPYTADHFVMCASLIRDKLALYQALYASGVTDFAVRDAEGSFCYLYEPSPMPEKGHYTERRRTIPNRQCINTTRYFSRTL